MSWQARRAWRISTSGPSGNIVITISEAAMLGSAGVLEGARKGCIVVDDASGEEFFQPAATVVLASFTLSNTRLLALSKIGTQYDPITRKGTLGRNLNPPGGSEYARLFR
jgi:hypothetical protein